MCYAVSVLVGWPQHATTLIVNEMHAAAASAAQPDAKINVAGTKAAAHDQQAELTPPPLYTVLPFVLMLAAIAILPLLRGAKHWWESNLHRFYVAGGLAALTVLYYALAHQYPIIGHFPAQHVAPFVPDESFHIGTVSNLLANAILNEYVPFMVLLTSLYTISGGIRIEGDLPAHPFTNTVFLAIGALLASFIGTTGAAMVLIRPLLETNRERKHVTHTVVLFTFIVCNCGGCLLPLGDPPLFLGYLQGVPFLWTLTLWKEWLFINGCLLAIYWAWDSYYFYPHEDARDIARDESRVHRFRFAGWQLNGLLLLGVILAVAFLDPSKALPGTDWHPWLYLREVVQLGLLTLSLLLGSAHTRKMNDFNFAAIIEVAVLFFGIFICMQPALQILNARGVELGLNNPYKFFWGTGTLSSFLDNAPTYLVFFQTANAMTTAPGHGILALQSGQFIREDLLAAISLGAVFMGSMTYIGNGPNFMVKSIAESWGVRMPSFFGYMVYSCAILLPLLVLLNVFFL
ncbi:MAG TPA: sodium:proton antiporter [Pirellulales bacterium]|nr:sodium:proton antiporter [Pirellulales bacterium]